MALLHGSGHPRSQLQRQSQPPAAAGPVTTASEVSGHARPLAPGCGQHVLEGSGPQARCWRGPMGSLGGRHLPWRVEFLRPSPPISPSATVWLSRPLAAEPGPLESSVRNPSLRSHCDPPPWVAMGRGW